MGRHIFFVVSLVSFVSFAAANGYVPVMLWTNIRTEECGSVPLVPGEYILKLSESEYFKCLEKSNPKVIKLFVTEELDADDLSTSHHERKDSKAFAHLQSTFESTSHVVMPAIQPSSVPTFLGMTLKKSFKDADVSTIELPRIERSSLREKQKSISVLDEMISEEMLNIPSGKYIAIFTGYSAPQRLPHSVDEMHFGRQLLAVEDSVGVNKTQFINFDNCIYIAFTNVTLTYKTNVWNLTDGQATSGACNENTSSIELTFTAVNSSGESKTMKLSLEFVSRKSLVSQDTWWNISSAIIHHNLNGTDFGYSLKISDHYLYSAPAKWSWVCALPDSMFWIGGTKDSPIVQKLQFYNLQMQPFDITNSSFSRALDCSGFLTAPIWMGTVISILLGIIFAFGIAALSAVTTMDRFDNPKEKTIQVHTHDGN